MNVPVQLKDGEREDVWFFEHRENANEEHMDLFGGILYRLLAYAMAL